MSWPKAFVRINGGLRTVSVWGATIVARVIDGKVVSTLWLGIRYRRLYDPVIDGLCDEEQAKYHVEDCSVVPLAPSHVASINYECVSMLERYGHTLDTLRATGVKMHTDGYGADVKQHDLTQRLGETGGVQMAGICLIDRPVSGSLA